VDIVAYNFTDVKAFHIPNYFIHGGIVLKPVKNLKVDGQLNWSDARLLRFELPITDGAYTPVRDEIVLDINALANYKINDKRIYSTKNTIFGISILLMAYKLEGERLSSFKN